MRILIRLCILLGVAAVSIEQDEVAGRAFGVAIGLGCSRDTWRPARLGYSRRHARGYPSMRSG